MTYRMISYQHMGTECHKAGSAELQHSQILEKLRASRIGEYLFQSPLDEIGKEQMAKLLLKAEGLNPAALIVDDYIARMWIYWQIGEKEKSLNNANRALNLDPRKVLALNCKVYTLAALERYTEASKAFELFIEVSQPI